jgi:signal transduction histidine kinase/CheY-like chemotaxis protein
MHTECGDAEQTGVWMCGNATIAKTVRICVFMKKDPKKIQLLAELSTRFLNISYDEHTAAIQDSLYSFAKLYGATQASIYHFVDEHAVCDILYHTAGYDSPSLTKNHIPKADWLYEKLSKEPYIHIHDIASLPQKIQKQLHSILSQNIKSLLAVHITYSHNLYGFLALEAQYDTISCDEHDAELLPCFTNLFANLLYAIKAHDIEYERALQSMLMSVVKKLITRDKIYFEDTIAECLGDMSRFICADRSFIMKYDHDNRVLQIIHEWHDKGIGSLKDEMPIIEFDMIADAVEIHKTGKHIYYEDISTFPPDTFFGKHFVDCGVRSLISIPIMSEGVCIGSLSFESKSQIHDFHIAEKMLVDFLPVLLLFIYNKRVSDAKNKLVAEMLSSKNDELALSIQKANDANKAKSSFLASLSHELRTPLNGVIGFANLLNQTPLNPIQRQYCKNINTSCQTLITLIDDILDLSKIEAGQLDLDITKSDLHELIEQTLDIIKFPATDKNLFISRKISDDLPRYIMVDALRLKQILLNLLSNAVTYTEKGEIELSVSCTIINNLTAKFYFSVRDTGIGMSPAQQCKLFNVLSQAQSTLTRSYGGIGLGLTICNQLAHKMGSSILVESEEGVGSTFSFYIQTDYFIGEKKVKKLFSDEKIVESEMPTADILNKNKVYQILIVDDLDINIFLLKAMIENILVGARYKIYEASNGEDALKIYNNYRLDIILMDVLMPKLDGYETTLKIRKIEADIDIHTPIIAITAGVSVTEKEKCFSVGMDDFISKPIDSASFEGILKTYLQHSNATPHREEIEIESVSTPMEIIHFDQETLYKNFNHNMPYLSKVMNISINQTKLDLESLKTAIENSDLKKINYLGHKMKGSNASMQFLYLYSLAKELERLSTIDKKHLMAHYKKMKAEIEFIEANYLPEIIEED